MESPEHDVGAVSASYGEIECDGPAAEAASAVAEKAIEQADDTSVQPYIAHIEHLSRAHDRGNVIVAVRLVIRALLEYCMKSTNRMLPPDTPQLLDLIIMLEKVLRHGFRASRAFLSMRPTEYGMWMMLDRFGRSSVAVSESIVCVDQLPTVQSPIGRVRAWLRLALMQKRLAEYFQQLVDSRHILLEFYEPWAVLRNESSSEVLCGSLIGLTVIDCNLCLKQNELHRQAVSIDLGSYVRLASVDVDESGPSANGTVCASCDGGHMKTILDQKNYLEELNKAYESKITNLMRRVDLAESIACGDGESSPSKVDELCAAMESMERSMHEKQDSIVSLTQQVGDVKKINAELYGKLRNAEQRYKSAEKRLHEIEAQQETERRASATIITGFEHKVQSLTESAGKAEACSKSALEELGAKAEEASALRRELAETNAALRHANEQVSAERERTAAASLQLQSCQSAGEQLDGARTECERLRVTMAHKDAQLAEYERTLVEMGGSLSQSKLHMESLRESVQPMAEAQWEADDEVAECKQCTGRFTATRRRHHCRNCGGIYCQACSENTMPLASSAKPVRVCDGCYELLLRNRHSAKPDDQ